MLDRQIQHGKHFKRRKVAAVHDVVFGVVSLDLDVLCGSKRGVLSSVAVTCDRPAQTPATPPTPQSTVECVYTASKVFTG